MRKYQLSIDGRPAGPVRDRWADAAQDAVDAGYASWGNGDRKIAFLATEQGAAIDRLEVARDN